MDSLKSGILKYKKRIPNISVFKVAKKMCFGKKKEIL